MESVTKTIEVQLNDGTNDHLECEVEMVNVDDEVECVEISSVVYVHPFTSIRGRTEEMHTQWSLLSPAVAEYSKQIMREAEARYADCAAEIAAEIDAAAASQRADEERAWRKEHDREAS